MNALLLNPTLGTNKYVPLSPLISAVVLADSITAEGVRLTTMELVYPRFIHAEVMTHRVFSRNASSSRAIPWKKMKAMLLASPAVPASWRMNERGMQGYTFATAETAAKAEDLWLTLMLKAIDTAEEMDAIGIHKQSVNRAIEPWQHIKTVMTGVYWENWDGLRDHPAADPTIQPLAVAIAAARHASTPRLLKEGQWHLPYVSDEEVGVLSTASAIKVSAARCARTSYNSNVDGKRSLLAKDTELHDSLLVDQPIHASPAEHQATPDTKRRRFFVGPRRWVAPHLHGNIPGWRQYRKTLANENLDRLVC